MNSKNRQQLLAVLTIVVVGLFVADKVVFTPLAEGWKKRGEDIAQLRKSIRSGELLLDREASTQQRWNEMRKNTLPSDTSHAEQQLLKAFDQWSEVSRVSVSSIKPQWKRGATDDYSVLECRVDAAGNLAALARFVYEVERSPMALKIEMVEFSARDNDGQQIALGLLVSGLRLSPLEKRS